MKYRRELDLFAGTGSNYMLLFYANSRETSPKQRTPTWPLRHD